MLCCQYRRHFEWRVILHKMSFCIVVSTAISLMGGQIEKSGHQRLYMHNNSPKKQNYYPILKN